MIIIIIIIVLLIIVIDSSSIVLLPTKALQHRSYIKIIYNIMVVGFAAVSQARSTRIAQYYKETGESRPERRGGFRQANKYNGQKEAIKEHIQQFTCQASHYGRRGT